MEDIISQALNNIKNRASQLFQPVEQGISQASQSFQNFKPLAPVAQGFQQAQQNFVNYRPLDPTSNQQGNFWSTPVAQGLGNVQKFIESPQPFQPAPTFQSSPNDNFIQGAGKFIGNIPSNIVNTVGGGILNQSTDLGDLIGRGLSGRPLPEYNDVKSPVSRLAMNANGVNATPQQVIGNLAGAAEIPLTAYAPTGATNLLEQGAKQGLLNTIKEGAISGAKFGGGMGVLGGLDQGRNDTLGNQLLEAGKQGALGAVTGGVLGGAIGGAGHGWNKFFNHTPEVEAQLRNKQGQWQAGDVPVKPNGMPKAQWNFQLDFNNKYGRNPYTPVYTQDVSDAISYELEKKGSGLSIRDVNKDKNPLGTPQPVAQVGLSDVEKLKSDPSVLWHGSPTGQMRGGSQGLHIGTHQAAQDALEARIGIPANGKSWDGTQEYGKTLLAGKKTQAKLGRGGTGFNVDVPENDFYPSQVKGWGEGTTKFSLTDKPTIQPVKIKGQMSNTSDNPMGDFQAGGRMAGLLKQGKAKSGYFYKNVSEDEGSISAVVPNKEHLEILNSRVAQPTIGDAEKLANDAGVSNQAKIQTIPLNRISGTDYTELDDALKAGKKLSAQEANDLIGRTEDPIVAGRKITTPVSVGLNSDGSFYLLGGNNRIGQALVNGDKTILATSNDFRTGQSFEDYANSLNKSQVPQTIKVDVKKLIQANEGYKKLTGQDSQVILKKIEQAQSHVPSDIPQGKIRTIGANGEKTEVPVLNPKIAQQPLPQDVQTALQNGEITQDEANQLVGKQSRFANITAPNSPQVSKALASSLKEKNIQYTPQTEDVGINAADKYASGDLTTKATEVLNNLSQKAGTISRQDAFNAQAVALKLQDQLGNINVDDMTPEQKNLLDTSTNILSQLSKHYTAAGQLSQSAAVLNSQTPQGLYYSAIRTLEKVTDKDGVSILDKNPELTTTISNLTNDVKDTQVGTPERQMAVQKLVKAVTDNIPRNAGDAVFGFWRSMLISGPETATKVISSYGINTPGQLLSRPLSAGVDKLTSLITGERGITFNPSDYGEFGQGYAEGVKAIPTKLATDLDVPNTSSFNGYDNPAESMNRSTQQTGFEKVVTRVHASIPKPVYTGTYNMNIAEQARTIAMNAGEGDNPAYIQDLIDNPTTQMQDIAKVEAEKATNMASNLATKASSDVQKIPIIGRLLNPIAKVPANIGVQGLVDYSPLGLGKAGIEVVKGITQGSFDQRAFSTATGKALVGTGITAIGAALMNAGRMALAQPNDAKERALNEAQNIPNNSVYVGGTVTKDANGVFHRTGGKWLSMNVAGAAGITLALGGGLAKGGPVQAGLSGARELADQPYIQGIAGFGQALSDPSRYGATFLDRTATSVVPGLVAQPARGIDTNQRPYSKDLGDAFKGQIPGLRQTLPEARNLYGQTLPGANPNGTIPGGALGTINPFYPQSSINQDDPAISELQRLYKSLGTQGPNIAQPLANQTINGQKVKLTPAQIQDYVAQRGPQIQGALNDLVQNPDYQSLSDEEKTNAINSVITNVDKQAKVDLSTNSNNLPTNQVSETSDVVRIVDPQTGNITTIKKADLNPGSGTSLSDLKQQETAQSKAVLLIQKSQIFDPKSHLTQEQAFQMIAGAGGNPNQAYWGAVAALPSKQQAEYVAAYLRNPQNGDVGTGVTTLTQNGVLSSGVTSSMYQAGLISADEANALKQLIKGVPIVQSGGVVGIGGGTVGGTGGAVGGLSGGRSSLLSNPMAYGAKRVMTQARSAAFRSRKFHVGKAPKPKMVKVKQTRNNLAQIRVAGSNIRPPKLARIKTKGKLVA